MPLSGKEVLRQNGSHIFVGKEELRETIPMHKELRKGLEAYLLKRLAQEK